MIQIDRLNISDDGQTMYLDAKVKDKDYYKNIYLDKVIIQTDDLVNQSVTPDTENNIYNQEVTDNSTGQITPIGDRITLENSAFQYALIDNGGLHITLPDADGMPLYALQNGKLYSGNISFGENATATLVIATKDFNPEQDGPDSKNVLKTFIVTTGAQNELEHVEYNIEWDKVIVNNNKDIYFYLYVKNRDQADEYWRFDVAFDLSSVIFWYIPCVVKPTEENSRKEVHLELNSLSFNEHFSKHDLSDNLFFVYIVAGGTVSADTPCGMDDMITLAIVYDKKLIYQNAMCYIKQLADKCNTHDGFIDYILNQKALDLAIETKHYLSAIQYYQQLKNDKCGGTVTVTSRGCGCKK